MKMLANKDSIKYIYPMQLSQKNSKNLVSAKRTENERSGVHGWHPYYAGYAETFVEAAIDYLDINNNHLLLDPWNGSGTTSLVCARKEIPSIGIDVNEAMNIFSMSKTSSALYSECEIRTAAKNIALALLTAKIDIKDRDPLLAFMSKGLCGGVRFISSEINQLKFRKRKVSSLILNGFKENKFKSPEKCFLKAALFVTARQLAGYKGGSNPTWIKTLESRPAVKKLTLSNHYIANVDSMLKELAATSIGESSKMNHVAILGSSRNLPIRDNSIDAIITSPPYLTRIDYAMSTRPELLILGNDKELRNTREATMGAPVIVDKTIEPEKRWGKYINLVLKTVREHSSKAAKSYYYPNMLQYFRDAEESLAEIIRVLKPSSRALIVVQSSYFKEHEIDLGKAYCEVSKNLGAKSEIVFKDIVRGHMAHVNTKSSEYKKDKIFYEGVVEIKK